MDLHDDDTSENELETVAALGKNPRILILGQRFLGRGNVDNPLFAAFSGIDAQQGLYSWWLQSPYDALTKARRLAEADRAVVLSEPIRSMLGQAWAAVFTSAVDATTRRGLELPGKRFVRQFLGPGLERISDDNTLPLVRLFGSVEREDRPELPPNDRGELLRRRQRCVEMLTRLPDLTTPKGAVFIDGWFPDAEDWLRPRDLAPALLRLERGQVLIFGASAELRSSLAKDDDLHALVESGVIRLISNTLSDTLQTLAAKGLYALSHTLSPGEGNLQYRVLKSVIHLRSRDQDPLFTEIPLPVAERDRIEREGITLPLDTEFSDQLPESLTERYGLFRNFIATGPHRSNQKWLMKLAYRHPVLDVVVEDCLRICANSNPQDYMILVHGQSGAGKTVLSSMLALELRKRGLPVMFFATSVMPINKTLVDSFCEFIEDNSSAPVFLVYDGMQEDTEYFSIASYLASRGRKCVIIGTSYTFQARHRSSGTRTRKRTGVAEVHFFQLPIQLSNEHEQARLIRHISDFIPEARTQIAKLSKIDLGNFFAIIYRILPDSRIGLSKGIIEEIGRGADRIMEKINEIRRSEQTSEKRYQTLLEKRLQEALSGLMFSQTHVPPNQNTSEETNTSERESLQLVNAVMVASSVRVQNVPRSLILRMIDHNIAAYRGALGLGILLEAEEEAEVPFLSARHPLEAEIWVRHKLSDRSQQFGLMKRLLLQLRPAELSGAEMPELEFAVKLLQAIGPHGPPGIQFKQHFNDIAELIKGFRDSNSEIHPRLLLIESHCRREWVKGQHRPGQRVAPEQQDLLFKSLELAQDVLRIAADIVRSQGNGTLTNARRHLLSTLSTERACVFGVKLGTLVRAERSGSDFRRHIGNADRWLSDAQQSWREALRYDDQNFQALDSACWILGERHRLGRMEQIKESELFADWEDTLERYKQIQLAPSQTEKLLEREAEMYSQLGDVSRFERVAQRAQDVGSNAIHILLARQMEQRGDRHTALRYLEDNCSHSLRTDRNLLALYFRLWWENETGLNGYFPTERIRLAWNRTQWEKLAGLAQDRLGLEGDNSIVLFLKACALVHLDATAEADKLFRYLDQMEVGGYRRSRGLMLITNSDGTPRQFIGEYQNRKRGDTPLAWCDELRLQLPFNPYELHIQDLRSGMQVGPFHVSLKFRGLYAEAFSRTAG